MDNSRDPSTSSLAYRRMVPTWDRVETLLAGTEAMRAAGEKYLPKYEHERQAAYDARLQGAVLFNAAEQTLDSWVGRPFSDPVTTSEDMPEELTSILDDVDLEGNDVTTFCRDWFREGLAKAVAHVLVDMPVVDREGRTAADDLRDDVRPYWSFIKPECLIAASVTMVDSREVLTHARIREQEVERDGFSERVVCKIRELNLLVDPESGEFRVFVTVWRQVKGNKWEVESGPAKMDINQIPLVTFYANRKDFMTGKPPVSDLVDLNIAHWQSSSDQRNILTVARFPILAGSGIREEESKVEIGPRKMLWASDPAAKFYYVEHSGASIASGRQDILDLEEKMASYGADFLRKRPGNVTATARALDAAEATSPLQDSATRFQDAMNQALAITAKWMGVEEYGSLIVSTDFGPEEITQSDLSELGAARRGRDLSREAYLAELKRRGALMDDFDPEENEKQLAAEEMSFGGGPTDGKDIDEQAEE